MSRYPNPFYDQFAAELNLQLKPPEADIKISSNLMVDIILYTQNIKFQLILRWFAYSSLRVVFFAAELNLELKPQANYIKISLNFTYILISPSIDRI
jgi:hypothetical protein